MSQAPERKKIVVNNNRTQTHVVAPAMTKDVVCVGCKLPHGMHLDIREMGQPVERVTLKGTNSLYAGQIIRPAVRGGFAITENVPKEFFDYWMQLNKHHPAIKNGMIFEHKQLASVQAMAEEREALDHGFNPIDPASPAKGIETRKDMD
jgi:hypothetical protein